MAIKTIHVDSNLKVTLVKTRVTYFLCYNKCKLVFAEGQKCAKNITRKNSTRFSIIFLKLIKIGE